MSIFYGPFIMRFKNLIFASLAMYSNYIQQDRQDKPRLGP